MIWYTMLHFFESLWCLDHRWSQHMIFHSEADVDDGFSLWSWEVIFVFLKKKSNNKINFNSCFPFFKQQILFIADFVV